MRTVALLVIIFALTPVGCATRPTPRRSSLVTSRRSSGQQPRSRVSVSTSSHNRPKHAQNAVKQQHSKARQPLENPNVYQLGTMVVRRKRLITALTALKSGLGAPVSGGWDDKYKLVCRVHLPPKRPASHLQLHAVYLCMTNWSWYMRHASIADGMHYADSSPTKPFYIEVTPKLQWMLTHLDAIKNGKKPPAWMRQSKQKSK